MASTNRERLWEVDAARTLAIAMMVVYHAAYDVDLLTVDAFNARQGGWRALQIACGTTFLLVVGVSFAISDARASARGLAWRARLARHARRGGMLLLIGAAISAVTFVALGDRYIRFGILHVIGASIVLAPFVVRLGRWNAAIGPVLIVAGLALRAVRADVPGLLLIGIRPNHSLGVDYYPLLPWFGVVMIGIAIGAALYPEGRRGDWGARFPALRATWPTAPGRRSLAVYLGHQVVLIPAVALVLAISGVEWSWP